MFGDGALGVYSGRFKDGKPEGHGEQRKVPRVPYITLYYPMLP